MASKKPQTAKQQKKQKYTTVFEEVEKFEDLAPRMQELLSTEPEGTRIYPRSRSNNY